MVFDSPHAVLKVVCNLEGFSSGALCLELNHSVILCVSNWQVLDVTGFTVMAVFIQCYIDTSCIKEKCILCILCCHDTDYIQ